MGSAVDSTNVIFYRAELEMSPPKVFADSISCIKEAYVRDVTP